MWLLGCALALVLAPALARAQATSADFASPPLATNGSTIAEQWDNLVLGHQGLATFFEAKVSSGTEPLDVLQCVQLGLRGQSTTRKDWRFCTTSDDATVLEQNTGTDASPTWVERFRVNSTGPTSAPPAHVHAAADTTSGSFANARISQASVEQWATQTPTGLRIPQADVSAQIAAGWIPQTGVTQYQNAFQINANQVIAGQFDDARIKLTNITQFGYLLQTGDAFLRTSGNCPTGTTEATSARGAKLAGADTAGGDINYPDNAGVLCKSTSVGSGCGAPDATNYTDFVGIPEMPLHTHTGTSHSHTTGIPSHSHLGPSHSHTLAHTHSTTIAAHTHGILAGNGDGDGTDVERTPAGDGNLNTSNSGGGGTFPTGAASTPNTGAGGTGATGLDGGGTFGSNLAGTGNTGSQGGTDPSIGPIFTVKICVVN